MWEKCNFGDYGGFGGNKPQVPEEVDSSSREVSSENKIIRCSRPDDGGSDGGESILLIPIVG